MAMGFGFTLVSGQQEVVKFNVSTTAPTSGFYLEQVHPVDGANDSATTYFLTGSAATEPVGAVPEPGSATLVAAFVAVLLSQFARRFRNRVG
jgi:hypothetical protein